LLGLVKPTKNLADAGALQALAKQYNYSPYGAGYIDWVALVQRLSSAPTGIDLEIAKAAGLPLEGAITDPVCKAEFLGLAQKVPRFVAGTEALAVGKAKIGFQVEFESTLAAQIMGALSAAPGTAGPGQGLFDFSLALPVLKVKDFWLKQADAVAAKPFACSQLAQLNEAFRDVKAKFDTTIPPPFSDLTGMRISITKVEPKGAGSVPDVAGKLLIGSSNPLAALGMAQMASPQLKDLKIAADGKPVALPAGLIPAQVPPMSVAMSDKALALSAGAGEDASLGAYLAAPSATTPVFARSYITGAIYGVLLRYVDVAMAAMPAEQREDFGANSKAFALYEKLIRSADITFEANASGIGIHETVETNPID
jgi:hypothetical protein